MQPSEALRAYPATQHLATALVQYHDVSELWHDCHADRCYNSLSAGMLLGPKVTTLDFRSVWWVPATYQVKGDSQPLAARYGLAIDSNWLGDRYVHVNTAITTICQQAEANIKAAASQLQTPEEISVTALEATLE